MGQPLVIYALVAKRAELSGQVLDLERQKAALEDQLSHIDHALAIFGYVKPPRDSCPPVQAQRAGATAAQGQRARHRGLLNILPYSPIPYILSITDCTPSVGASTDEPATMMAATMASGSSITNGLTRCAV